MHTWTSLYNLLNKFHTPGYTHAKVRSLNEDLDWGRAAHAAYGTNLRKNSRYNTP
tara:strand:- start:105 stop:269 length:165 start_codon:yes stop_codon:yes gene_type:complete